MLFSWKTYGLPSERIRSLLLSLPSCVIYTVSCMTGQLIHLCLSLNSELVEGRGHVTSFLNSSIHQPIHWWSICYVLSREAWNQVWGRHVVNFSKCWEDWEEWACLEPCSLYPISPIRGDSIENGERRKTPRKLNKTRYRGVRPAAAIYPLRFKGNPCLALTGCPEWERNRSLSRPATSRVLTQVCFCHHTQEKRGQHARPKSRTAAEKGGHLWVSVPFLTLTNPISHSLSLTEEWWGDWKKGQKEVSSQLWKVRIPTTWATQDGPRWRRREEINGPPCCHPVEEALKRWITFSIVSYLRVKEWGSYVEIVH